MGLLQFMFIKIIKLKQILRCKPTSIIQIRTENAPRIITIPDTEQILIHNDSRRSLNGRMCENEGLVTEGLVTEGLRQVFRGAARFNYRVQTMMWDVFFTSI